jgi:hypothetical protein
VGTMISTENRIERTVGARPTRDEEVSLVK